MPSRHEFSRADRVRKALIREVSDIISNQIQDPRLQDVVISVTDVDITHDLRHARIFISVMSDDPQLQKDIFAIVQEAKPQIRSEIGQRIRLRFTPDIELRYDESLERGTRVSQLLDQIARGELT